MITIFSTCKPMTKPFIYHQWNALRSWSFLPAQVIVFGDEPGIDMATSILGFDHIPDIPRRDGKPRLDKMWKQAEELSKYDILCYVNSDIIFLQNIILTARTIQNHFKQFLASGQRYDIGLDFYWHFADGWSKRILSFVKHAGMIHAPCGKDYYIFSKGIFDNIPPFVLGANGWDNWILHTAITRGIPTIDTTRTVTAIHHDHKKVANTTSGVDKNIQLFDHRIGKKYISITDMAYEITETQEIRRR